MRALVFIAVVALTTFSCSDGEEAERDAGTSADADQRPDDADTTDPPTDGDPPPEDADDPPDNDADDPPIGDGCGSDPGGNDRSWTLSHDGRDRSFFVHVPAGYDRDTPTPVVLNFHGRQSNPQQQITVSRMIALSDDEGFIAVHPAGVGQTWNGGLCCGEAMNNDVDDVGFTAAIIDRLVTELCVDDRRVYATGLSNGGFMSHRLGCDLADRIAAIAPVAGPNGDLSCSPSRAMPVFHFHGTADNVVPYNGFAGQLSVDGTMRGWVDRNGCNGDSTVFFEEGDVLCEEWSGCRDGVTVRLCTIDGGGHQWPGGTTIPLLGHNTNVISASQMMWDFFEGFALP